MFGGGRGSLGDAYWFRRLCLQGRKGKMSLSGDRAIHATNKCCLVIARISRLGVWRGEGLSGRRILVQQIVPADSAVQNKTPKGM